MHFWRPGLVVAGDDPSVHLLHRYARWPGRRGAAYSDLDRVLRDSLGHPRWHSTLTSKVELGLLAPALGIATPSQRVVHHPHGALAFARDEGYPVVIKAERGTGGRSVFICHNEPQVRSAVGQLLGRWAIGAGLTRLAPLVDLQELFPLHDLRPQRVLAQRVIKSRPATYAVACLDGVPLAGYGATVEQTYPGPTGPSSALTFMENGQMEAAVNALVRRTRCSGFVGFDFVIDDRERTAYLLECNPRATPLTRLGGESGIDLAGVLLAGMRGEEIAPTGDLAVGQTVAFFPQEWLRARFTPYLQAVRADVPWDDPGLLDSLFRRVARTRRVDHIRNNDLC